MYREFTAKRLIKREPIQLHNKIKEDFFLMNIFQVLTQGKSRLHEPSMSAILGYLLDSNKDHGLGDSFIRKFLEHQTGNKFDKLLDTEFITSQVSLEEPYQLNGQRKDIDIQITLLNTQKEELHRIVIENKIKSNAANPEQLQQYYKAILEDDPYIENLHIVFLTPNMKTDKLKNEFNNLQINQSKNHSKDWIFWNNGDGTKGILEIIKEILELEAVGAINPINEYMRHTLKAFIGHFAQITHVNKRIKTGEDIGEIVDSYDITFKNIKYRIIRRDSNQIQIYNTSNQEKVIARKLMIEYIEKHRINITYADQNTRTIGRYLLEYLHMNEKKELKHDA